MDIFQFRNDLVHDYGSFITSFHNIADSRIQERVFKQRLEQIMQEEGRRILVAHQRVRNIVAGKQALDIVPHLPIDLISLNVLLPGGGQ